jgi:uncharacterized protein (TIGR00288 family)
MTAQFARSANQGRIGAPGNPQAALLIDFDNVTMGIRSDLTKELKSLLNSDIIKGKVAVQRAYADWRRYPQYIVPLAEASVDLIFAPAYGSSKKNATDIRLAIDALELVFTRSEIGTFILLSGDSDFSSLVLKLKEYGKYVVGVGIRESASDLLVQNCDEYYSYSALTGLTRAGDEVSVTAADPWELVDAAVRQMVDNGDVMRSDRLKQVILEMDPNFDEKQLGFPKFNRFVQEASNRGLLRLHKMENGQYEVALPDASAADAAGAREEDRGDGRRGRGRRGRGRDRDRERPSRGQAEPAPEPAPEPQPEPRAAAPAAPPEPAKAEAPKAEVPKTEASKSEPPRPAPSKPPAAAPPAGDRSNVAYGYELLRRATGDLTRGGGAARDSDVKRRMLELDGAFDESAWGFSKFSRFLRQAHDVDAITMRKLDNGGYEVLLGDGGDRDEAASPRSRRDRSGPERAEREREARPATTRDRAPRAPAPEAGEFQGATTQATKPAEPSRTEAPPEPRPAQAPPEPPAKAPAVASTAAAAPSKSEPRTSASAGATPARGLGMRRGSRGGRAPSGPPPLLEGQTVARPTAAASAATPPAQTGQAQQERPRGRGARAKTAAPKRGGTEAKPDGKAAAAKTSAAKPAAAKPAAAKGAGAAPVDAEGVLNRLVGYKGVGRRSAEALVEAFGAANVFDRLAREPERVKEVLGARRGEALLEAHQAEQAAAPKSGGAAARSAAASSKAGAGASKPAAAPSKPGAGPSKPAAAASESAASESPASGGEGEGKSRRTRGRRGGRRGKRSGAGASGNE